MSRGEPSFDVSARGRARSSAARLLALTLGVLAAVLVVEGGSLVLWRVSTGAWFSAAQARELRAAAGSAAERSRAGERRLTPVLRHMRDHVVHPYVGYVIDVDSPDAAARAGVHPNERGFLELDDAAPPGTRPGEPLSVGIFGGSVAMQLSLGGRGGLVAALEDRGYRADVRSYALGGYKQPQQLMALAYAFSLGDPLDVVVNLDGFNDLVLPADENERRSVFPFYPRTWDLRSGRLPDTRLEATLGEQAYLARRRRERADRLAKSWLTHSPTAHLVWLALDRRDQRRQAEAEESLEGAAQSSSGRRFATHGPPSRWASDAELLPASARLWARSSVEMRDLASGQGALYLHFLQPNQYVEGSKTLSGEERRTAFREDHRYRGEVQNGWRHLQAEGRWLREQGVDFHDLTDLFVDVRETVYADACCHFNQAGYDRIGREIASLVIEALESRERGSSAASSSP